MRLALAAALLLAACKDAPPERDAWPLPSATRTEDLPDGVHAGAQVKDGALLLPPGTPADATSGDWVYLGLPPDTTAQALAAKIASLPGKCVAVLAIEQGKYLTAVPLKRCCGDRACDPDPASIREVEDEQVEVRPQLSIRVFDERIWVSVSRIEEHVAIDETGHLEQLTHTLAEQKHSTFFAERQDVQLGVAATIPLDRLLAVRDVALGAGFTEIQLLAPRQVAVEPHDTAGSGQDPDDHAFPFERAASTPPGGGDPRVRVAEDAASYRRTVRDQIDDRFTKIKACFTQAAGSVSMSADLVIEASGKIATVEMGWDDHPAASCVRRLLLGMKLPPRSSGKSTKMSHVIEIQPSDW